MWPRDMFLFPSRFCYLCGYHGLRFGLRDLLMLGLLLLLLIRLNYALYLSESFPDLHFLSLIWLTCLKDVNEGDRGRPVSVILSSPTGGDSVESSVVHVTSHPCTWRVLLRTHGTQSGGMVLVTGWCQVKLVMSVTSPAGYFTSKQREWLSIPWEYEAFSCY